MGRRLTTLVSVVLTTASAEAGLALLPLSHGGVLLPLAAQQASQAPRYRPGAGLIEQIRSGDVYRFGGARAPGRDWAFGWKETITDPAFSAYGIKDFQERIYGEATSTDLPALRRFVDLVIGVNINQTSPVTDGRHWKVSLLPGEMFMHPSSTNQLPTARFTVPAAGEYTITGFFQNIGCGGTINGVVSVVSADQAKPAVQLLAERASTGAEAPYKIIRDFNKGDLIDFSVDAAGNYSCDSTRLDAQIVPSQRVQTGQNPPTPQPQPPKVSDGGAAVTPPSQGQPGQVQAGKGETGQVKGASKSKSRPAPSGVLDLQVKWWLWPGNQTQPKPQPKPDDKAAPSPVKPPVATTPAPIVTPPVQPITPQPDPKPTPAPAPEPAPQPRPQPPQPQPQPQPPKPQPPQQGGVGSVDYSPIFARGVAKAALGDKRGAIADFNQAIAINPRLAPAYYSRGLAKWDLNDKAGACADFKTARELGDVAAAAAERRSCPAVQPPGAGGGNAVKSPVPTKSQSIEVFKAVQTQSSAAFASNKDPRLVVDTSSYDRTPYTLAKPFSASLLLNDQQRVVLSGNAEGTAGWSVDNFLLIEIVSNQQVRRFVVGNTSPVSFEGKPVQQLGASSYSFGASEIELSSFLPRNTAFTLRIFPFDYGGVGLLSNLFLVIR